MPKCFRGHLFSTGYKPICQTWAITLLLVVAGSFVAQGELKLWEVITFGILGAVTGDQIGYCIGRWGGRELVERFTNRLGGAARVEQAEGFSRRWGGMAVFFSRWLATPLGPWMNLVSGTSSYSWLRFTLWDTLGEIVWVFLYVLLGKEFSDRVQALADILGNATWLVVGIIMSIFFGWLMVRYFRNNRRQRAV